MEKNNFEELEDLLADASFKQWVAGEPGGRTSFWDDWVAKQPEKKDLVEKAVVILKGLPFAISESPLDPKLIREEWQGLRKRTIKTMPGARQAGDPRHLRIRSWRLRIAAGILFLVALGAVIQQYLFNPVVQYRTPFGKQLSIVLPDSTTVELNANSLLSYRKQYPRKVWLDGEAFFHVKKKPASGANFRVLTNDLTVEVLGTAFNVIEKENKTEVILEKGSVKLNLKRDFDQEFQMEPGDLVTFSAGSTQPVEKRQVKPEILTSWKDGVQEFEDVRLSDVMERIQAIYGWETLYFNEKLKTRKISIALPSEDLENAILMLSKTMDISIEKVEEKGKVLLLR